MFNQYLPKLAKFSFLENNIFSVNNDISRLVNIRFSRVSKTHTGHIPRTGQF